jgi:effector-binding domain-containing protein
MHSAGLPSVFKQEYEKMQGTTVVDHLIGEVRIMTVREERFFCVTTRAPMETLDQELDRLMPLLEEAQAEAGIAGAGPTVVRYFVTEEPEIWQMDVGVPVTSLDWVRPARDAEVVTLPEMRCGALLHWGSLEHIHESYATLNQGIAAAGLKNVGEGREWYMHFQGDVSDDTIVLLQLEVAAA